MPDITDILWICRAWMPDLLSWPEKTTRSADEKCRQWQAQLFENNETQAVTWLNHRRTPNRYAAAANPATTQFPPPWGRVRERATSRKACRVWEIAARFFRLAWKVPQKAAWKALNPKSKRWQYWFKVTVTQASPLPGPPPRGREAVGWVLTQHYLKFNSFRWVYYC